MEEKARKKPMPTLVERFEAVVRENEQLKQKLQILETRLEELEKLKDEKDNQE